MSKEDKKERIAETPPPRAALPEREVPSVATPNSTYETVIDRAEQIQSDLKAQRETADAVRNMHAAIDRMKLSDSREIVLPLFCAHVQKAQDEQSERLRGTPMTVAQGGTVIGAGVGFWSARSKPALDMLQAAAAGAVVGGFSGWLAGSFYVRVEGKTKVRAKMWMPLALRQQAEAEIQRTTLDPKDIQKSRFDVQTLNQFRMGWLQESWTTFADGWNQSIGVGPTKQLVSSAIGIAQGLK